MKSCRVWLLISLFSFALACSDDSPSDPARDVGPSQDTYDASQDTQDASQDTQDASPDTDETEDIQAPDVDETACDLECNTPPAATCVDADTLRGFVSDGRCEDDACIYEPVDTACPLGCEDGACLGDPCAEVICDQPPSECYESAGTCQNGQCNYDYANENACDDADSCTTGDVCQSGQCVGEAVACNTPPAPTCKDATTLSIPASAGLCGGGGGGCNYATSELACAFGCQSGACKVPDNFLISEVYYDSPGADTDCFIEIHGPANTPVNGLSLVAINGSGGAEYSTINLNGQTNSEGFFVVMQPSAPAEWVAVAEQIDDNANLQNGPDSVQLRFGDQVIDALAYGDFSGSAVAAGLGEPATATLAGQSLSRDENLSDTRDNFTDFQLTNPSPGSGFSIPTCTDACTSGSTVCDDDSAQKTCEMQPSGCLDWSAPIACASSETCTDDQCQEVQTDDWFDPQSCSGTAWSVADALARLGSSDSEILDSQTFMERSRTCDSSGCGAWSTPSVNSLRYLTWSGGVTTRYINLQTDTTLVLYKDDDGAPRLSLRHDTHLAHYPDDHDQGIVFGFPSQMVPYPKMRAWKLPPSQHPYDYTDLEAYWLHWGQDAKLHVSAHCARFEAVSPARDSGLETVREYVAVYRF